MAAEKMDFFLSSRLSFTFFELIAVLMVLSPLVALAVPRYIDLENNAPAKPIAPRYPSLAGGKV